VEGLVKVLILARSYFRDGIERLLEGGKFFKIKDRFRYVELERDDEALKSLLRKLGLDDVDEIVEKSFGIFYYAIVLAEFYKNVRKECLERALRWKHLSEGVEGFGEGGV